MHEDTRRRPPCESEATQSQCPKFMLHPPGYGLMPANHLAVKLYHLAAADQRAGMGGCLIRTLSPQDAKAILDEYADEMPTIQSRKENLEKMFILDEVVTRMRQKHEEMEWKRQQKK